jgi:pseudouridine-5'-phosphate glycosidase
MSIEINTATWIQVLPCVARAIKQDTPIVALESSLITNGLPKPVNLEIAMQMRARIKTLDVEHATVAILKGQVHAGLTTEMLEELSLATDVHKISRRDIGPAIANRWTGGTTVAGTMIVAHALGIRIFGTGGIGGVHRGDRGDVSTDLTELAKTPVAVVCSGAKSILDLPKTLEWLETEGVPVIGWQTDEFPAFFSSSSGLPVSVRVDTVKELADILHRHWEIGGAGALITVPCPEEAAVSNNIVEAALESAHAEADRVGITGQDLTPFILNYLSESTDGATLRANLALLLENAYIAAQIAKAL